MIIFRIFHRDALYIKIWQNFTIDLTYILFVSNDRCFTSHVYDENITELNPFSYVKDELAQMLVEIREVCYKFCIVFLITPAFVLASCLPWHTVSMQSAK